jgi:hypothetical protein
MQLTDDFLTYDGRITIPCRTDRDAELEALAVLRVNYGIQYTCDGSRLLDEHSARWKLIEEYEEHQRFNDLYQAYHQSLVIDVFTKIRKLSIIQEISPKMAKKRSSNEKIKTIKKKNRKSPTMP